MAITWFSANKLKLNGENTQYMSLNSDKSAAKLEPVNLLESTIDS